MTRVTLGVLPQVDAAIFVILAQSPFSGYEAEFLNRLLTHELGRVIFVVNRMDEIRREPDKARILQVVRDRIAKGVRARAAELHGEGTAEAEALIARIGSPKVFGVAGAVALDAKLAGDQAALDRSGFPAFEAALERFLALERGVVTLLVMADAAIAAARKLQAQASIRKGALSMRTDEFEAAWQKTSAELDGLRAQLAVELGRIQQASHTLRAELRPRAGQLSKVLVAETHAVIDAFPLDADAVSRAKASATAEKMSAAVRERLLAVARRESERVQGEIEAALQQQVAELQDFGAQMEAALAAIELRFSATPTADEGLGAGVTAGAGAVTSAVGGWLLGGALSGAFTGYQVAGIRGAAAGAAAGAAVGFGTVMTGGLIIAALGLPVTFPVVLPMLVIAGLASSFGARWFTRFIFSDEQLTRFREAFRREVVGQLEAAAPARTAELEASTEQQVRSAFAALQKQVETELGGVITTTQRTLDDLRTQRTRAAARSETELAELEATVAQAAAIEARMRALSTALRAMQSTETQERS